VCVHPPDLFPTPRLRRGAKNISPAFAGMTKAILIALAPAHSNSVPSAWGPAANFSLSVPSIYFHCMTRPQKNVPRFFSQPPRQPNRDFLHSGRMVNFSPVVLESCSCAFFSRSPRSVDDALLGRKIFSLLFG